MKDFPVEALGDKLGAFAEHVADAMAIDPGLAGVSILGVVSAALGDGVTMRYGPYTVHPNLYLFGVAEPGAGKRVLEDLKAVISKIEAKAKDYYRENVYPEKAAAFAKLKKESSEKGFIPTKKYMRDLHDLEEILKIGSDAYRYIVADFTSERLMQLVPLNESIMAIFSADGRKIIDNMLGATRKGSFTDEHVWTQFYCGEGDQRDRINSKENTDTAACRLSAVLMVQPDKALQLLKDKACVEGGLASRILIANCKNIARYSNSLHNSPALDLRAWERLITTLLLTFRPKQSVPDSVLGNPSQNIKGGYGRCLSLTPRASQLLDKINDEIVRRLDRSADHPEKITDVLRYFAVRWVESLCKVILVTHFIRSGESAAGMDVDRKTVWAAFRIWFLLAGSVVDMLYARRVDSFNEMQERILEMLSKPSHRKKGITLRDIRNATKKDDCFIGRCLENLIELKEIKPQSTSRTTFYVLARGTDDSE